ncbi:hypothetical protein ROE7235_03509 [Roseibaca ekhonensis]|uniref:Lipoprotein n=2 Tax=Rhodobacterales TaxID=204455 RepID=A0A0L6CZQ0_9RHOB|nr:hypothetical protein ROTO_03410 [Roseovarius tolerans]SEM03037.1 hypothetical protein SAMN04488077_101344 [Roseovarius tolerans]SUZ33736.1 hypothetical protein ROE7235_03509 [Roseibaca ekhonensis]
MRMIKFVLAVVLIGGCAPSEPLRNQCGMELRLGLTVRDQAYNEALDRICFEQLARERGQSVTRCMETRNGLICASD